MTKKLVANELRIRNIVECDGDIYEVKEKDFVIQGSGGSTVKLVLENINTNSQKNLSVNADFEFTTFDVTEEEFDYVYDDGDSLFTTDGQAFPVEKVAKEILALIPQVEKFRVLMLDNEIYKILLPR